MGRLIEFIQQGKVLQITGPYSTRVSDKIKIYIADHSQMPPGVQNYKRLGAGCSALLTPEGQAYLREIALDYLHGVPADQPLVVVTPSFRLDKQTLEAASRIRGVDPNLPAQGLRLSLDSIEIVKAAMSVSGRSLDNTLLAMSAGPPFECYKPETAPGGVEGKYLPQVFAAVRFGHELDYVMFETVSSWDAALGAAMAFTRAHGKLNIEQSTDDRMNSGTITYLGNILETAELLEPRTGLEIFRKLAPSYDPKTRTFGEIPQTKDYVISLCLTENGTLEGERLEFALNRLWSDIGTYQLYPPVGISINCNSPEVTREALRALRRDGKDTFGGKAAANRRQNIDWIIGAHPNASSEPNPRNYENMTETQAIPHDQFAAEVSEIEIEFNLKIVGGCCGTDHDSMTKIYEARKAR